MCDTIKIIFLGDISLNNRFSDVEKNNINPFENIKEHLDYADYIVGNLESFCLGDNEFNFKKKPYLYMDENSMNLLKKLKLNLVTLAHNHVYDTLYSGFNKTINFLLTNRIQYIGVTDIKENDDNYHVNRTIIKNKTFTFLNYCHLDTNPVVDDEFEVKFKIYKKNTIISDIKKHKINSDYIILLFHWGGKTDYGRFPDEYQVNDSKLFIDSGADAIIGGHSHTIQVSEIYKKKPIYYSLGNFCFDDIISHDTVSHIRPYSGFESKIVTLEFRNKDILIDELIVKNEIYKFKLSNSNKLYYKLLNIIFFIFKKFNLLYKSNKFYLLKIEPIIFRFSKKEKSIFKYLMFKSLNLFNKPFKFRSN